jgi:hypothetical protein
VRHALPLLFLAATLAGCPTDVTDVTNTCTVEIAPVEAAVRPGEALTLLADPLTASWDTRALIGGLPADVLSLDRLDCSSCDACRAEADCESCGDCADCTTVCAPCVQSVTVAVPSLPPGEHALVLYNSYGSSRGDTVEVEASGETDAPDSEPADSEPADSEPADSEPSDSDSDPTDSDPTDSEPSDSDSDPIDSEPAAPDTDTDTP